MDSWGGVLLEALNAVIAVVDLFFVVFFLTRLFLCLRIFESHHNLTREQKKIEGYENKKAVFSSIVAAIALFCIFAAGTGWLLTARRFTDDFVLLAWLCFFILFGACMINLLIQSSYNKKINRLRKGRARRAKYSGNSQNRYSRAHHEKNYGDHGRHRGHQRSQQQRRDRTEQPQYDDNVMSRAEALLTLGLQEGFSQAELKARYRKLIMQVHPDRGGSDALFQRVQTAYEILRERS